MESTKHENGTYTVVFDPFPSRNKNGVQYSEDALQEAIAAFNKRADRGVVRSEVNHPKRMPGATYEQFVERVLTIDESRVCAALGPVEVVGKVNEKTTLVKMVIRPTGPHGDLCRELLSKESTPHYFGLRAFSDVRIVEGKEVRDLKTVVTFDLMAEDPNK
jgi:hypothetical protein